MNCFKVCCVFSDYCDSFKSRPSRKASPADRFGTIGLAVFVFPICVCVEREVSCVCVCVSECVCECRD